MGRRQTTRTPTRPAASPARLRLHGDAARHLMADKRGGRHAAPQEPEALEPPSAPAASRVASPPPGPDAHVAMPGVYTFQPRRSVRRLLTVALLVGLFVATYFVSIAVEVQDTGSIALAAIASICTALVWAIRGGASPTSLTVRRGQLEVNRQGTLTVLDLTSTYTPVEVVGTPGRRGWKVLFRRTGMAPFVIDAAMVDPHDFMRVLVFFRPGLTR